MSKRVLFLGYGIDPNRTEAVSINSVKHIQMLENQGFQVFIFNIGYKNEHMNTGETFLESLRKRKRILNYLKRFIREKRITHVVDEFVLPLSSILFTIPLKKSLSGVLFLKEIHNSHGSSKKMHTETLIRLIANNKLLYTQLFKYFDVLFTNSIDISVREKITYVPTPISVKTSFSPSDRQKPLSICYLGHPLPKKGVYEFLKLFPLLSDHLKGGLQFAFALSAVGPKKALTAKLKTAAVSANIPITFEDTVSASNFFRKHDVYVLPIHDQYGAVSTPNTVLEAMEAGAVTLVSQLPSLQQIFIDKEHCLYLKEPSATGILEKLLEIAHDSELRRHIRINARNTISSRYDEAVISKKVASLYE